MGKVVLGIVGVVVGLFVVVLVGSMVVYGPAYVGRVLRWGDADVYDYQKFPERPMAAGEAPFHFSENSNEALVRSTFASSAEINDLDAFLAETRTQAFIVIQDGNILYEQYYNGAERDSIVTSFSIAKSFTSALVGIAIEEGYIQSVDDPITDYLPELAERDPQFSQITIRHLLMMSSGIHYEEFPFFSGDDAKTYYYPDLRRLALEESNISGRPGEAFLYNNYHPLLLGLILERATGVPVAQYLQDKIWRPLGAEYEGSWSLDEAGFEKMESGINGRAIDFAKFGQLYLQNGEWQGTQLVPAEWVTASTQAPAVEQASYYPDYFNDPALPVYYGYMWWGIRRGEGDYDFSGLGNHGQFLYVSPHKRLVIVRHGETYGVAAFEWFQMFYDLATALPDAADD
jgi:CubicO group peptidase (beta-lactamase class C family)